MHPLATLEREVPDKYLIRKDGGFWCAKAPGPFGWMTWTSWDKARAYCQRHHRAWASKIAGSSTLTTAAPSARIQGAEPTRPGRIGASDAAQHQID